MSTSPLMIEESNLSTAWCKVLKHIIKNAGHEITPLLLTLTGFEESEHIKKTLDASLNIRGKASIQTVAETIFPDSLYQYLNYDRNALYIEYKNNLSRVHAIDKKNKRGTYFERLIAYDGNINQLEIILSSYLKDNGVRRSKLQASIFDARKDHTNSPYQGFPCLQHVTFSVSPEDGLILNSFYAVQYLYERAYGNWLGLINLGKFMANELQLKFERFNCYVGVEQLDNINKTQAKALLKKIH